MRFIFFILLLSFPLLSCDHLIGTTPDPDKYPVLGIDISHHQGPIDWTALGKDERVQFVFMKATEGGDFKDTRFQSNWKNAQKAGIPRGAYHFWSFCRTGKMQAQNFIASVPVEKNALPPVLDLEFVGSCKERPSIEKALVQIKDYLNIIEQHYNKKPILYTMYDFYNSYLKDDFKGYDFWIRDLEKVPNLSHHDWLFWQYSNFGFREGIKGRVDLNAFAKSQADFEDY